MAERLLPIFPLPGVVLFPGTELPLHIFEPRYRELVADLLGRPPAERLVGMMLVDLDPESGEPAVLEPGCAGRLVAHAPLADGRSDIVLAGEFRFRLERELPGRAYRRALVATLEERVPLIEHERAERLEREIVELLASVGRASRRALPVDPAAVGSTDGRQLAALVNRLAAGLDLPALRKQSLLAEAPLERAEQVAGILRSRLKLLTSLGPFRHLAGAAELN
jgi:Lon protease-like protein